VTRVERIGSEVRLYTTELDRALIGLVEWAEAHHQSLKGLRTRSATLEDLFLTLTGRSLRD
jgi:ABC-2 type transport system ATP-binding protein